MRKVLPLMVLVALAACDPASSVAGRQQQPPPPEPPVQADCTVSGVQISPRDFAIIAGTTVQLTAARRASCTLPPPAYDWAVSDSSVLRVEAKADTTAALTALRTGEALVRVRNPAHPELRDSISVAVVVFQ
jgi:hypothetical protein